MEEHKVKITYGKYGLIRHIGHLDTISVIFNSLRRAKVPVSFTQGFNPRIKASFSPPLPLGFSSDAEFMEVSISGFMKPADIRVSLQRELPEGLEVKEVMPIPVSMCGRIEAMQYGFNYREYKDKPGFEKRIGELLALEGVRSIETDKDYNCLMTVELGKGRQSSPRNVASGLLGIGEDEVKLIKFTRKKFIFKL